MFYEHFRLFVSSGQSGCVRFDGVHTHAAHNELIIKRCWRTNVRLVNTEYRAPLQLCNMVVLLWNQHFLLLRRPATSSIRSLRSLPFKFKLIKIACFRNECERIYYIKLKLRVRAWSMIRLFGQRRCESFASECDNSVFGEVVPGKWCWADFWCVKMCWKLSGTGNRIKRKWTAQSASRSISIYCALSVDIVAPELHRDASAESLGAEEKRCFWKIIERTKPTELT